MKTPTWGAIAAFCAADGWTLDRQSTHTFFEKTLPDGTGLQTHVPHGKQGQAIGPGLFHFILRTQLEVSAAEFSAKAAPVRADQSAASKSSLARRK